MSAKKNINRVLFGVLNWGLGHATRSAVLIEYLLSKNIEVQIASDGDALAYLKREFPSAIFHKMPSYNIKYASKGWLMSIKILGQIPKIKNSIRKEHFELHELTKKKEFDLILSDNRYGFYSTEITSLLLTHQLQLATPSGFGWVNIFFHPLQKNFDSILIPDYNQSELSGKLSKTNLKHYYIGPLSCYQRAEINKKDIDFLIVLSGPEPQRTILENKLIAVLPNNDLNIVLVRGSNSFFKHSKKIEHFGLLQKDKLQQLLTRSKTVISRSGYTTIMDISKLNIPAILIPTPGQTEQEYLARINQGNEQIKIINQQNISSEIFEHLPKKITKNKSQFNGFELAFENAIVQNGFAMPT